ncbi:MAG: DUF3500 domain-containing protein [Aridibacter sp.]
MKLLLSAFLILIIAAAILISFSPTARSILPYLNNSEMVKSSNLKNNPATAFLNSLNPDQKKKALMPIDDASRDKWHYLPSTFWSRSGIQLGELTKEQKDLAFKLLASHLSKTGYDKTRQIISLEEILAEIENNPRTRDPEKYHIAFYGNPATDKLWAWSFEGHHISLNFMISDDKISIAPRFLGANPATIETGKRKGERTLADEEDLGLELINSLTSDKKQKAIFQQSAFRDIVTTNETKVEPLDPVGIKLAELNKPQKDILVKLINVYLSTIPEELATKRMDNLNKEEFNEIRFGWAGATESRQPHYYRIQGKTFLVEFDNTQNNANHIHSVWRDFDGDFGKDLLQEHYKKSDHHK